MLKSETNFRSPTQWSCIPGGSTSKDLLASVAESHQELLDQFEAVDLTRFLARATRSIRDSLGPLTKLYGAQRAQILVSELFAKAAEAALVRPVELRRLDAAREVIPDWFQSSDQLGYVAYCELFGPTISDVGSKVQYLADLGVTYLHLMKVLEARAEPNDGGFAVKNYRNVEPALGSNADLVELANRLRASGISLCVDLVMNHTAKEHEWAVLARTGDKTERDRYRDFYLVYPDRTEPDDWEKSLPEVFPEMAPGNFTFDPDLNGWVWTTFNSYQWDLNYANPAVLVEMLETMLFLANLGVDVLRLDAVAFTWKRKGTDCQNQPEAHLIAEIFRAFTSLAAPGVLLKAEAIVGPRELTAYLGAHGSEGERNECQLAYHNQLMVNIWSSLATGDATLIRTAMARLAPTPRHAAWATYVRCHDDIGWAVDDIDAAAAGINGVAHRKFLAEFYRGEFPGSFARGASFSINELTGDERTCGTTASLAGLEAALESGDFAAIEAARRRIVLAYGVAASFGMPLLYMGDEVGMLNDRSYLTNPAQALDSRWMQRPRFDALTVDQGLLRSLVSLFKTRAATGALRQGGDVWVIDSKNPAVFAFGRYHPREGRLLGLANFSGTSQSVDARLLSDAGLGQRCRQALSSPGLVVVGDKIEMPYLSLAWFVDDLGIRTVPD